MFEPTRNMDEDQLRRLLRVTPTVAVGATVGAFVACYHYLAKGAAWPVFVWLALFSLVSLARIGASLYHSRGGAARFSVTAWYRWTVAGVMAHALLWGACSFVLFDFRDPWAESVLHIVLASIYISAAIHLSGFYPLLIAYVSSVLSPLILRDVLIGGPNHLLLALMCAIAGLYVMSNGRSLSRTFAELLAQRRRNAELIKALRHENERSENALRAAELANAARTRVFAAANHDLRQPLHAMGLLSQTLVQRGRGADASIAQQLSDCVDGMTDVVDDLLEITRLDGGHTTPQWSVFDAAELIREGCRPYEATARAKGLQLRVQAEPAAVRSDRVLLLRVLSNLVVNAVRYTRQGSVSVTAKASGNNLHVSVEDTGIGIADEHLARIFEEFYQVGNPARDRRLGLGLGLATVKRLSGLLSLKVSVQSAPGRGSAFSFVLPIVAARTAAAPPARPQAESLLPVRRILVIEDDADSRNALVGLLQSWGCQALGAQGLSDSLAGIEAGFEPQALVVDLRLADGASGIDAVIALRARLGRELPAVIATGDVGSEHMMRAQAAGLAVMVKPVRALQLRAFLSQSFSTSS